MMNPICSVIIPAYNCEKYLASAVESVRNQTFKEWEIIILDDCSTDGTPQIARKLEHSDVRIRFLQNESNIGVARTRNRGVELARGRYTAFLDSDDLWLPDKLEKQVRLMEEKGCMLSCTSYELIDENGRKLGIAHCVPDEINFGDLLRGNTIGCSTAMAKREFILKHPMNCEFYHEDYATWLDMLKDCGKAFGINRSLVQYRVMSGTKSRNKLKAARHVWDIYRRHLKFNFIKSVIHFSVYAINGLKKYGSLVVRRY